MENFPFLSVIALSPIATAIIILFLSEERKENARMLGLAAMIMGLILSAYTYVAYYQNLPSPDASWRDTLMFVEEYSWVPGVGINYIVGVDGLSVTLVLLTAIVGLGGVLISWGIEDRPREFFAFFMLLVAGVHGVFVAVDGFLLFFFYELAVLPMYILIVIWGWEKTREYAAMKLTLYLLIGSFIALVPFLVLYFNLPELGQELTFDLRVWAESDFPRNLQLWTFLPIFLGFGVLAGLWPFHNWSPDGHVAAPTAVSMIHAGVLMKLGAYAAMRVGIHLLPDGAVYWLPFVIIFTVVNVIYGALIAMRQRDMKYLIGYSSVSHMGLVSMGFAAMNVLGFTGAAIQMVSHGVMTALFFAVVGMIYDRAHTRDMDDLSGMVKALPATMVAFTIGGLVSMGMPGLSGFVAEFPIFLGVWAGGTLNLQEVALGLNPASFYPIVAILSVFGIIITAAYIMRAIGTVFLGDYDAEKWHDMRPLLGIDIVALVGFSVILIVIGVFPSVIAPVVQSGVEPVVARLNDVQQAETVFHSMQMAAIDLFNWLGGA
ncbi:MAG TPA: NADH-quinone oxidoreductase subunit M [Candidatus Sulfomarinibacteraceae bacterium]|nr:NADH-quinone oxidoreductase subunit M [Candidatus Sulfomarinibacteraceae bacterium]